jgi:hypothetical protein
MTQRVNQMCTVQYMRPEGARVCTSYRTSFVEDSPDTIRYSLFLLHAKRASYCSFYSVGIQLPQKTGIEDAQLANGVRLGLRKGASRH